MFVANSLAQFRQRFTEGLAGMLAPDGLGAYILVMANSLQCTELRAQLAAVLDNNFRALKCSYEDGALPGTSDDLEVFKQLLDIGPDRLEVNSTTMMGDWVLQSNSMRALRPARAAAQIISRLQQPFDANAFNFNKPFLRPEILWEGAWSGVELRVLYNKFPLAPYHLLIVPDAESGDSQFLTRDNHELAMRFVRDQQQVLPGLYLGYNSLGGYASVNHMHFHAVLREKKFPVESNQWKHHSGGRDYPLALSMFESVTDSWNEIEKLHVASQAYNLLYTSQGVYVMPRKAQNTIEVPALMQGAGWAELGGEITVSSMQLMQQDAANTVSHGLKLLSV